MDSLLPAFPRMDDSPYSLREQSADELTATWGALRTHSLKWHPDADLDEQLRNWELTGAGDRETAAVVSVPSRAVAAATALARHGFAPLMVTAARRAGRPGGRPSPDVVVRRAGAADVDFMAATSLETARYDGRFGMVTVRPSTGDRLREEVEARMGRDDPGAWVAERDGEPLGVLHYDVPPHSDWMVPLTCVSPVAYLSLLGVSEAARSTGVGSALAARAHQELDDAGVELTLLHHSLPNPRSTPFWYSHGYRPLWTTWQRRPALGGH